MSTPFNNPWGGNSYGGNPYSSSSSWGNNGFGGVNAYAPNPPNNFVSNVLLVTSLEEAIMKTPATNSDVVYFNQGKDEFYRVRADQNGNKSWKTFAFYIPEEGETASVMKKDLAPIYERLGKIEDQLNTTKAPTEA